MKKHVLLFALAAIMLLGSINLYSQTNGLKREVGLVVGGFSNFALNKNYLKDNIKGLPYVAPYVRVGKHEFYGGLLWPFYETLSDHYLNSRLSAIAGYKYYVFNPSGRENLFVNYSFQYLGFKGGYDNYPPAGIPSIHSTRTQFYINNIFSLGYVLFLDPNNRFGFYYTLGYIIARESNKDESPFLIPSSFSSRYLWNRLSTNIGFSFKLKGFDKK